MRKTWIEYLDEIERRCLDERCAADGRNINEEELRVLLCRARATEKIVEAILPFYEGGFGIAQVHAEGCEYSSDTSCVTCNEARVANHAMIAAAAIQPPEVKK